MIFRSVWRRRNFQVVSPSQKHAGWVRFLLTRCFMRHRSCAIFHTQENQSSRNRNSHFYGIFSFSCKFCNAFCILVYRPCSLFFTPPDPRPPDNATKSEKWSDTKNVTNRVHIFLDPPQIIISVNVALSGERGWGTAGLINPLTPLINLLN